MKQFVPFKNFPLYSTFLQLTALLDESQQTLFQSLHSLSNFLLLPSCSQLHPPLNFILPPNFALHPSSLPNHLLPSPHPLLSSLSSLLPSSLSPSSIFTSCDPSRHMRLQDRSIICAGYSAVFHTHTLLWRRSRGPDRSKCPLLFSSLSSSVTSVLIFIAPCPHSLCFPFFLLHSPSITSFTSVIVSRFLPFHNDHYFTTWAL